MKNLDLAILFFLCKRRDEEIAYPRVLFPSCCTQIDRRTLGPGGAAMGTMEGFSKETLCRVWTTNFLTVAGGIRDAGAIVRACGLDPGVATRQDMDDLEPLLEHPVHDTEENMKSRLIGSRTTRRIHSWRSALRFQVGILFYSLLCCAYECLQRSQPKILC